jgi:hypothetical protein
MLKIYGRLIEITPGEWKQSCEILHDGSIVGFVDRERTPAVDIIRTRNMRGDIVDGERLDWLLHHHS